MNARRFAILSRPAGRGPERFVRSVPAVRRESFDLGAHGRVPFLLSARVPMPARDAFRLAYAMVRADRSADTWGLGGTSAQRAAGLAFFAAIESAGRDQRALDVLSRALDAAWQAEVSR
jgi:hypothetical protein